MGGERTEARSLLGPHTDCIRLNEDSESWRTWEPTFASDDSIRVVIESPRGSALKLKYDPDLDVMTLSRPLTAGLTYPYDWGFVPSTRGADGDPIDAIVIWDATSYPGVVLQCRPVGILHV